MLFSPKKVFNLLSLVYLCKNMRKKLEGITFIIHCVKQCTTLCVGLMFLYIGVGWYTSSIFNYISIYVVIKVKVACLNMKYRPVSQIQDPQLSTAGSHSVCMENISTPCTWLSRKILVQCISPDSVIFHATLSDIIWYVSL